MYKHKIMRQINRRLILRSVFILSFFITILSAQIREPADDNTGIKPVDPPGGEVIIKIDAGLEDQRISDMGIPGVAGYYQALEPDMAFNSTSGKILVVWRGDDDPGSKDEIYGQLIDVLSMQPAFSEQIRIAEMPGSDAFDATRPAVVYNRQLDEFLVVWQGVERAADDTPQGDDAIEIFGRRVSAAGELLDPAGNAATSTTGFLRISQMGTSDDNGNYDGLQPAVAWDANENAYLVVWHGDDDGVGLVNGEFEIFGQRLIYNTGSLEKAGGKIQISDVSGANGNSLNDAKAAAVEYNEIENEWLVVWEAVEGTTDGPAIYGQRLKADGSESGENDFLISETSDPQNEARQPALIWNGNANEYLIVWSGEGGVVAGEYEIYGQILSKNGIARGGRIRISDMGPDGNTAFRTFAPDVTFNANENEFMVTWSGDDDMAPLVNGEFEVFAQKLDTGGNEVGDNDFRVSDMGPDSDIRFAVQTPVVSYNGTRLNSYLFAWSGDDDVETVDDELEIFARLLAPSADLEITKTDSLTEAEIGGDLIYTIMVKNNGPDPVFNTTVADTFSADLTKVSWTATGDGGAADFASNGTGHIFDHHITLPAGASIRYRVQATVSETVTGNDYLANRAVVIDSVALDPDLTNNSASDNDTWVRRISDLAVAKDDSTDRVLAGSYLTYYINVKNLGPHGSLNTMVTDTLPTILSDVSWRATGIGGATGFDTTGTGMLIDSNLVLPAGAMVRYALRGLVDINAPQDTLISNTAYAYDKFSIEPDSSNNFATDNDTRVIQDTIPPVLIAAGPRELWPPNHEYVNIDIKDCVILVEDDRDGPIDLSKVLIDSVSSDEPENENGVGDGDTWNDILFSDDCRNIMLRSERQGSGNGRVYTIYLSVEDAAGNKATAFRLVQIPHSKNKKSGIIDDGPAYVVVNDCAVKESVDTAVPPGVAPEEKPKQFVLLQNIPNPFNPETEIRFELPEASHVELKIYNMLGQVVRTVTDRQYGAGYHTVRWNGIDDSGNRVASGVYIYRMRAGAFVAIRRLVLTK